MMGMFRVAAAIGLAALSIGATPNWLTTVAVTDGGHRLGNPNAKVKLVAYESYTCPHCREFEAQGSGPLKMVYIQPGKVSLEVRHALRDPIDLTAAMLANCGAPAKFFGNHDMFFATQPKWIKIAGTASKAQQDRWYGKDKAAARRAIATDFGFYPLMEARGYTRAQLTTCLNDEAKAKKLADIDQADNVRSTPTFALNGLRLAGTAEWELLRLQIDARL